MEEQTISPTFKDGPENAVKTLSFPEAMREVILNKEVTRLEWRNSNFYGCLKDGLLTLHKDDGKFYQWIVSDGDLLADDWIVL